MYTNIADIAKYLQGLDLSEYEPNVDWQKLAQSGISFCYLRASHGLHLDTSFASHRKGANSVNLPRGFYHYFVPTISVARQVRLFVGAVKRLKGGDLPPVLDIEDPPAWSSIKGSERLQLVLDWLEAVEHALGVKPMIYCSLNFVKTTLEDPEVDISRLAEYPLWIAEWHVTGDEPTIPSPWNSWTFWQYSDKASFPGVDAQRVDGDVFHGTAADLLKLQKPQARFRQRFDQHECN